MVMTFRQVEGRRREIRLVGRSMPFRPVEFTEGMGVTTTWHQGSPVAAQQVTGRRHEPTTFEGRWDDRYLASESTIELRNFPVLASGSPQGGAAASTFASSEAFDGLQLARTARTAMDAFLLLEREGIKVRMQWESIVRYGTIKLLTVRPGDPTGGIERIGWSMEIEWSGDRDEPPIPQLIKFNALGAAKGLTSILSEVTDVLSKVADLRVPNAWAATAAQFIAAITEVVSGLADALTKITTFATAPIDLISTIKASLQEVRSLCRDVIDAGESIVPAQGEASKLGDPAAVAIAALIQQLFRSAIQRMAAYAADQLRQADLFSSAEVAATVVADSITTLRDVAEKQYGDANRWTVISTYNGFFTSTVPAGTVIQIPKIG